MLSLVQLGSAQYVVAMCRTIDETDWSGTSRGAPTSAAWISTMCGRHDMNVVGTCEDVLWCWFLTYVAAYFGLKSSLQICCQQTRIGGSAETFFGPPILFRLLNDVVVPS